MTIPAAASCVEHCEVRDQLVKLSEGLINHGRREMHLLLVVKQALHDGAPEKALQFLQDYTRVLLESPAPVLTGAFTAPLVFLNLAACPDSPEALDLRIGTGAEEFTCRASRSSLLEVAQYIKAVCEASAAAAAVSPPPLN